MSNGLYKIFVLQTLNILFVFVHAAELSENSIC